MPRELLFDAPRVLATSVKLNQSADVCQPTLHGVKQEGQVREDVTTRTATQFQLELVQTQDDFAMCA
jgi:hypothetical protein